ncbi:MAG: hypothetical protein GC181_12150 [Bacteroidetes bacterium]|nr:hypothetical protein [Bacteroidota bacterium]
MKSKEHILEISLITFVIWVISFLISNQTFSACVYKFAFPFYITTFIIGLILFHPGLFKWTFGSLAKPSHIKPILGSVLFVGILVLTVATVAAHYDDKIYIGNPCQGVTMENFLRSIGYEK